MTAKLDLAGIGAGPFNLAVAALINGQPVSSRFYDAKPGFSWHSGLMLPNACMQTSYLKDLVTPVDPTNTCSFLNYLVTKRRFYDFMNAEQSHVSRQEYADYLAWVADRLPNLHFDSPVEQVEDYGDHFRLRVKSQTVQTRRLCVAAGKRPHIPTVCQPHLSRQCFHALDIGHRDLDVSRKRVAVIGGGQTGAEVVLNLLDHHWGRAAQVQWISRRSNLLPLDETPFSNDWFTPNYVQRFRELSASQRAELVAEQKLASDGISPETLKALYQRFYQLQYLQGERESIQLRCGRDLTALQRGSSYQLHLQCRFNDEAELLNADIVILCTGLEESLPECLGDLAYMLPRDEHRQLRLEDDFSVRLPGSGAGRLYLLNMGRHSHGIAEPQLSLSAWRAACVVNSVLGNAVYDTDQVPGAQQWLPQKLRSVAVA